MRETSGAPPARFSSLSPKARNNGSNKAMSENDKWAWFSDEDATPALFKPEPSSSKTDTPGLRLDIMAPDAALTPAGSASLGKAVALHLEGKSEAAVKELLSAIEGGENLAELHAALGHIQFELKQFDAASKN